MKKKKIKANFQNVNCFVFEQSKVFYKAPLQNVYNVNYFKTPSMCIFNTIKNELRIVFMVDALFGNFAYLHNLYTQAIFFY